MKAVLRSAASDLLRPVLSRPAIPCPVVAASHSGVHVATGDDDVPVLSLVAAGGARLPGAICLAAPFPPFVHGDLASGHWLEQLGSADHMLVGDGVLGLDEINVVVHRWWGQPAVRAPDQPARLRTGAAALSAALNRSGRSLPEPVVEPTGRLSAALDSNDKAAIAGAVHAMVGLGPGLTPAADDVLVGALLCWHHVALAGWLGADVIAAEVAAAVRPRLDRTTTVSAALLHHAIRGCGVPEALLLIDALRAPAAVAPALVRLCRVGHDTGTAMAYGVAIGLTVVLAALEADKVAG